MNDLLDHLCEGFTLTGELAIDAGTFLRRHRKDGVAEHVARVAEEAQRLAVRVDAEKSPAIAAAWLHDISLVLPSAAMVGAARELGLNPLPEELKAPGLLHGKLSSALAEQIFGVNDPAVLDAIRCHTTLRANASLLDKVLFVADKLSWDPADAPYHAELQVALEQSLDEAVWCFVRWAWGRRHTFPVVHPWLEQAYEDLSRHK